MPEYNGPDYSVGQFEYQAYCDKCDFIFNLPLKILFLITELSESEEEEVLITEDMSFQDPTEDTETEQYLAYPNLSKELELKWYNNNEEKICPKRVHDINAGFDLQYPRQSSIIIAPHSLVKIDLKIALEILVSTMIQVVSQSSLAKKKINIKKRIINAGYMGNIIIMLQNNLNRPYKIELQEKIAQAIFLLLVKIPQLTPVTTQKKLGLTVQGINRFGSSGRRNVPVNFMEEDSELKDQDQALLFEASPKICFLADIANLYLPAKAHKHFRIPNRRCY
ncbi:hypothetical protein G9A89_015531 [Geosiphon pyriformis]|nr:hypothetical protein G9A89_015531 [Geosiphon pyriformis]